MEEARSVILQQQQNLRRKEKTMTKKEDKEAEAATWAMINSSR